MNIHTHMHQVNMLFNRNNNKRPMLLLLDNIRVWCKKLITYCLQVLRARNRTICFPFLEQILFLRFFIFIYPICNVVLAYFFWHDHIHQEVV